VEKQQKCGKAVPRTVKCFIGTSEDQENIPRSLGLSVQRYGHVKWGSRKRAPSKCFDREDILFYKSMQEHSVKKVNIYMLQRRREAKYQAKWQPKPVRITSSAAMLSTSLYCWMVCFFFSYTRAEETY
jgi:hypothetical protein